MKKILALTALLSIMLPSCENNEDAVTDMEAGLLKTEDMRLFEKKVTDVGTAKSENGKAQAIKELVLASREYISLNNGSITESATDTEIINLALDLHLQRINDLRKNNNQTN